MVKSEHLQWIPTKLNCQRFEQFVLPDLSTGRRGPAPKLSLHTIFNHILQQLYEGCQRKELPIEKDQEGHLVIHYTRVYCAFRRWLGWADYPPGHSGRAARIIVRLELFSVIGQAYPVLKDECRRQFRDEWNRWCGMVRPRGSDVVVDARRHGPAQKRWRFLRQSC